MKLRSPWSAALLGWLLGLALLTACVGSPAETETAGSCTVSISCATILDNLDQLNAAKAELDEDKKALEEKRSSLVEKKSELDTKNKELASKQNAYNANYRQISALMTSLDKSSAQYQRENQRKYRKREAFDRQKNKNNREVKTKKNGESRVVGKQRRGYSAALHSCRREHWYRCGQRAVSHAGKILYRNDSLHNDQSCLFFCGSQWHSSALSAGISSG